MRQVGGKHCKGKLRQVGECASKSEHPRFCSGEGEEAMTPQSD